MVDTSSICDIECDGTVDFSDNSADDFERGADQYAKIHKSYEYTLSSNILQSTGGSLQSKESKFLLNFDSKPGF